MAKEWYLMQSPHNQVSGFEGEALLEYGEEGFLEALDSEMACDIEVCNYDLSERLQTRAIIQDNVQDTKLKTLNRLVYTPIGTCKAGMYVYYDNRYWLIVGIVGNNKVYEKSVATICNYKLTWIGKNGKVIQRWANIASASQYNNGETGFRLFFVRSDQLLVSIPDDEDSLSLDSGIRFVIDRRTEIYEKEIDSNVTVDTSYPLAVYELTRSDSVLYDYQDSGHFELLITQTEKRNEDGYYVIDGVGYWLAQVPTINEAEYSSCSIIGDSDIVYIGVTPVRYSVICYDVNDNIVDSVIPEWTIDTEYMDYLKIEHYDNSILISTDSKKLANKTITLCAKVDGFDPAYKDIKFKAFI